MAQDLKLAKEILEPEPAKLRIGQFWRDVVNGDVLKIMEVSDYITDKGPVPYVRCACYPRGEYYMGIQEMKASHFESARYMLLEVGWLKRLWYRWKFKRSKLP